MNDKKDSLFEAKFILLNEDRTEIRRVEKTERDIVARDTEDAYRKMVRAWGMDISALREDEEYVIHITQTFSHSGQCCTPVSH